MNKTIKSKLREDEQNTFWTIRQSSFLFVITGCKALKGTSCTKRRCWLLLTEGPKTADNWDQKLLTEGTKKLPKLGRKTDGR